MRLLKVRTGIPVHCRTPVFLLFGLLASACAPDADPGPGTTERTAEVEPPAAEEGSGGGLALQDRDEALPLVLFVGTSLTEGLGLGDPEREAWPARVESRAADDGMEFRFRNAGLSGETSAGALRRIDWVLDEAPAVVVLETGANDGLRGIPVSELEANLDGIFARVRDRAPEARLVLAGMEAPPNLGAAYVDDFRAVFPRVARRWDAELIPFLLDGVAGEAELNQSDRIHPTATGHDRMAEGAWVVLQDVLRDVGGAASGG